MLISEHRCRVARFLVAACLLNVLAANAGAVVQATLDPANRHQVVDGFGTSLAWFAPGAYNGSFAQTYYEDLGATKLRFDMVRWALSENQSINPARADVDTPINLGANTYDNIDLFNFQVNGLAHVGSVAQAAPSHGVNDLGLVGTIWSPPHWMKGPELQPISGQPNGNQPTWLRPPQFATDSKGGTLIDTPQNIEQFGRYVTAYVKGFEQEYGVALDAVSIQNEALFSNPFDSAVYTPAIYVKALKAVDSAFAAHNAAHPNDTIDTQLIGIEHGTVGTPGDPFRQWNQHQFNQAIRADPQAFAALDIWATHNYSSGGINPATGLTDAAVMWEQFLDGRSPADFPSPAGAWWQGVGNDGKPVWLSEASSEHPSWLHTDHAGRQDGALLLAVKIHEALVHGDANAYLYWQATVGQSGASADSLFGTFDGTDAPKYNAAKHYFKNIRPGAERIDTGVSNQDRVLISAYLHEADNTLALVLINTNASSQTVELAIPEGLDVTTLEGFETNGTVTYSAVSPFTNIDGVVSVTLGPYTVLSLTAEGVLATLLEGDYNGDGFVSQSDLDLVLLNWGDHVLPPGFSEGAVSGGSFDGLIGQNELDGVLLNWGDGVPPPGGSSVAVPEPAAGVLLLGLGLFTRPGRGRCARSGRAP